MLLCLVSALLLAGGVIACPALRAATSDLPTAADHQNATETHNAAENTTQDGVRGSLRRLQRCCNTCGPRDDSCWLNCVPSNICTPPAPNPPPTTPTGCGPSSPCCDRKIQEVWVQACAKTCDAVRQAGGCMALAQVPDFLRPLACAKKCFEQMNTMPDCMCSGLPNGALPCPPLKSEWDDRCCALSGGCSR
ncbi:unnamed protein product [Vitrella brassicaformis CCMP3155]|uniref:Uncharacterized protein n=1 Tax=Vitrella brassicaformis (strain CCMP3155) TaxID=1169540 RepID=A0A0G4F9X7_VITBC|nr:unnamed protein product [Vitrella brassicaformis CCMP3155]|eukprot:CEM09065.1 unnamed protein product [Vitrella brassicaformis CCMP3155]